METNNVDVEYVRIIEEEEEEEDSCNGGFGLRLHEESIPLSSSNVKSWKRFQKWIAICISLAILAILITKWIGPFAYKKVFNPNLCFMYMFILLFKKR